jgi:hypothetical protein
MARASAKWYRRCGGVVAGWVVAVEAGRSDGEQAALRQPEVAEAVLVRQRARRTDVVTANQRGAVGDHPDQPRGGLEVLAVGDGALQPHPSCSQQQPGDVAHGA